MTKLLNNIYKLPWCLSLSILLSIIYLIGLIASLLPFHYEPYSPQYGFWSMLLLGSILAPLIETFIFQYLPYKFFEESFFKYILLISVISGVIFGLLHWTTFFRVVVTSSIGFCLQLWFGLFAIRYGALKSFWMITFVHAVKNLISTMVFFLM